MCLRKKKTSTEQKGKKKVILNHTKKQPPSKKNRQEAKLEALTAVQKKDKERGHGKKYPGGEDSVPKSRDKKILPDTKTYTKVGNPPPRQNARLEPLTCGHRVGRSTVQPESPGVQNPPGGDDNALSTEKTPSIQLKPQTLDTKKKPGRETPPKMLETPPSPIRFFSRGPSKPSPGGSGTPFDAPRSPSLALGPVLSPITPCAAMWGGRGAVLRLRGIWWRSGAACVKEGY